MKIIACIAALFIAGCATKQEPVTVVSSPIADCAKAVGIIASTAAGDATSKVVAIGAIERLCAAGHMQVAQAPQQSLGGTLWQAALQAVDIGARIYGIKATRDVGIVQSNNATALGVSTNAAFTGIASSGFASNAAIAQNIQAPAPNITLSGAGVIGSGSYTVPTTTTTTTTNPAPRVCSVSATGVLTCQGG